MKVSTRAAAVAATAIALLTGSAISAVATDTDGTVNTPVKDDRWPKYGSTLVDTQHYDLNLAWYPGSQRLTGTEQIQFRATGDAASFSLDLSSYLTVSKATLDGQPVTVTRKNNKATFNAPVTADSRHVLTLKYAGKPHSVGIFSNRVGGVWHLGWLQNKAHEAYAEQEPFGAFTWYAVNDQPSDKATYSFTISAPEKWVGVANGVLTSRKVKNGRTITNWNLDSATSSYLTTIGIGPYKRYVDRTIPGFPMSYWIPRGKQYNSILSKLRYTPTALKWLEKRLGDFPFSSLSILSAPEGGMETQTMITLGRDNYSLSKDVIVHEIAHQWFGDEVSPLRWNDAWLNEGWAMYMAEVTWSSHGSAITRDQILGDWDAGAQSLRDDQGPPAKPYADSIFSSNIYVIPALMWDMVRQQLGDDTFWRLAKQWPADHRFGSADYQTSADWWSEQSGVDLHPLFQAWLLGPDEPAWSAGSTNTRLSGNRQPSLRLPDYAATR